ncbi:MAG: histidine kinase [Cellulophaga sp.]
MKKIILLALLIGNLSFAQKPTSDSIHKNIIDSLARLSGRLLGVNIDSSETIANYMLKYSEKHHFLRGQGQALGTLAGIYNSQGDNGKSLLYHKKTISIFKELGNDILTNRMRVSTSILFLQAKEYKQALAYVKKAQEYYLESNNNSDLARTYHIIGIIYENTNKGFDELMFYLKKAEEVSRSFIKDTSNTKAHINLNTITLCGILNSQSEAYINRDKGLTFAIDLANKSLKTIKKSTPDKHYFLGMSYFLLGKAYWKKKEFKKALLYNDSSLVAYKTMNYIIGLKRTYESRKDIFASLGNFKDAFEAAEILSIKKDTLNKEDRKKEFSRMKVEYETDRIAAEKDAAEARAQLAEATNKQNKNYLIGSIVIAVLILLSSLFYFARLKAIKISEGVAAELREAQSRLVLEQKYKESELKALKSQMNPHFIFNALNSIQEYIITNKKNEASDYLGRFADLIRRYLNHSDSRSISLIEEVESLQMYLDLEALRFEKELSYSISLSKTLDNETIHIPTMMVQPYLENAIRHGLLHKKGKRKLLVSFTKGEEGIVICVIEDNGVGRKRSVELNQKRDKNHKSFAEKATQERLDLINHGKEQKVGVLITDLFKQGEPSGTKIILSIPIL